MVVSNGRSKSVRITTDSVATGSVWESRMRIDKVKGGIKVFNGGADSQEVDDKTLSKVPEQTSRSPTGTGSAVKGRACKSEGNAIQIVGDRSPSHVQKKINGVSPRNRNGGCRSPVHLQRKRPASVGDGQRSPVPISNARSEVRLSKTEGSLECIEPDRPDRCRDRRISMEENNTDEEDGGSKQETEKSGSDPKTQKVPAPLETERDRSDEDQEKEVDDDDEGSIGVTGDGGIDAYDSEDEGDEDEEMVDVELEVEKDIYCDEKIPAGKKISHDEKIAVMKITSDSVYQEEDLAPVKHSIPKSNPDPDSMFNPKPKIHGKPTIAMTRNNSSSTQCSPFKKPPPKVSRPTPIPDSDEKQRVPESQSMLQSLVDLVMWEYVPRSALVFGVGSLLIISSSYTNDLNVSFISVISYLGLIYLAITFLYKSFKNRHIVEGKDSHRMEIIGEEDAMWVLRMILPFVNESLLKLNALFSGDPAMTMKLAALLFALARCGSSITLWKMSKLGFFAVFILPKFYSSYSAQLSGYGTFWILRFQDAWRSCSHKKVVGFLMFTMVWNSSSVVARTWAAFMLFVAVRYYHQSLVKVESWGGIEDETNQTSEINHVLRRRHEIRTLRQGGRSTTSIPSALVDIKGAKKVS